MKFKKSIIQELIAEVEHIDRGSYSSFEESGPATASIQSMERGSWLWISGHADHEGATWDPSTDRASGDPYSLHISLDWVGEKKKAPISVSSYEELNKWALLHTRYKLEYTDVGSWGIHSDRYVNDVSEDGIVSVNVVTNRRFQDVSPISETERQSVDLSVFSSASFDDLLGLLENPNPFTREVSAKILGNLGDPRAIDPHLIRAVDDESVYVQNLAIRALGKIGGPVAMAKLSHVLTETKYPPPSVIEALSELGQPAVDSVSPCLESEHQSIRIGAVTILQNIAGEKVIRILRDALQYNISKEYTQSLKKIISALGVLEAKDAVEDILPFLYNEDYELQREVVDALKRIRSEQAIASLIQGLLKCHHWNRKAIVEALDEMGWQPSTLAEQRWILFANEEWEKLIEIGEPAEETILRALTDEDAYHRGKILSPLGKAGSAFADPAIATAIISIYEDKEQPSYRQGDAIRALVCVPTSDTISFLLREFPEVQDKYVQGKFLDTLKNMVLSDFDIASEFVSRLERMNPEMQSKKEIAGFLELFKVIPLTLKQLHTVHPWVTSIAKNKLGKDQKDVVSEILSLEQVIPAITSEVMDTRKKAMNELSKIRIPSAVFPLLKALEDDHYYIREQVPKLIGNLGEGAVSNTISALQHEDHRVRIGAAEALGRLRFNYSVEPLIAALHDEHRIVRQNAAWALGRMHRYFSGKTLRKENVLEALENCMRNDDYLPARLNAVYSLGELDDPKVIKLLLEAMDYPEMEFRLNATHGFLNLSQLVPRDTKEGSQIIDRLIAALSDDAIRVVYNAVDGLRLFGGEKALEAVQKIKADNDPELVELVEDAIKEIKSMLKRRRSSWSYYERVHVQLRDPDVIEELIPLLMDESESNQRSTQIALGKFGALAYDRMIELLTDKEQHYLMRMGAAATLGEIGDKRATDILIETLDDEHDDVRCNAAWALAEIKDKRSLNALLKATNDTNWQVRLNAGAALGKIKGKGTLDALLKLSRDKHPQVRLVCMSFLGQYKSSRVLPALKERLKDQDSNVRKMARDWIKHLEKKE